MKIGQRVVWNQQAQRDRTFLNNKPDIIIRYHKEGTCTLIDVAVSGDRNVVKTAAEEILKYKNAYGRNTANVECKNKDNTINNRSKWSHIIMN